MTLGDEHPTMNSYSHVGALKPRKQNTGTQQPVLARTRHRDSDKTETPKRHPYEKKHSWEPSQKPMSEHKAKKGPSGIAKI